jgi:hypothetical protein
MINFKKSKSHMTLRIFFVLNNHRPYPGMESSNLMPDPRASPLFANFFGYGLK